MSRSATGVSVSRACAAWTMLGVALSAYEQWLGDASVSLPQALGNAFDIVGGGLNGIDDRH